MDTSKDIRDRLIEKIFNWSLRREAKSEDLADSTLQVFKEYIEVHKQKLIPKGKIYCNCDCGGPFCNTLMHQCHKPNEHYPQREQSVIDIQNEVLDRVLEGLEKEKEQYQSRKCKCKCHKLKVSGGLKLQCDKCGSVYLGDREPFHHKVRSNP